MAIKINGQDLLKRYINGQEIVRVYKQGIQIRPETVPPLSDDYLCFTAQESNSSVTLGGTTRESLEISYDKSTWMDYTIGAAIALSNVGDKVYFRNKSETPTRFSGHYFTMTGKIGASGDTNYLLCKNSTTSLSDTQQYCFENLFANCTSLTTAPQLPATELSGFGFGYYSSMFKGCTSLTTAPQLPATSLSNSCYASMFQGCTSLTTAPQLPATSLAIRCYAGMFRGCSSLTVAPQLPATSVGESGYSYMFAECTSLTTPPQLPATNIGTGAYFAMFLYCTSLTKLPQLPATTIRGYNAMFGGCTSIKLSETQTGEYQTPYRIPSSGTGTIVSGNPLDEMFSGTGGTFTGTPSINTTYYTSNQVI